MPHHTNGAYIRFAEADAVSDASPTTFSRHCSAAPCRALSPPVGFPVFKAKAEQCEKASVKCWGANLLELSNKNGARLDF